MKSRLVIVLVALAIAAAACTSGNPIATVGGASITDEAVNAFHAGGEAGGDFDCTLDFLINSEVLAEVARTELGVTATGSRISDYLDGPPAHRVDAMATLRSTGGFSDEGVREQVRRWVLADLVVDELEPAGDDGTPASGRLSLADNDAVVNAWVAGLAAEDMPDVVVDPLFGAWSVADLSTRDACASVVLATVGGVQITERDVADLAHPDFPVEGDQFDFRLQFLISTQLYLQEAEERFGIVLTEEDVNAYIVTPPPHRVSEFATIVGTGQFSLAGITAQARRWMVADRVNEIILGQDPAFLSELATSTGLGVDEIAADPLAFIPVERMNSVFNAWTTGIADAGELAEVVIDPAIGEWDPVFRQFTRAGG